MTIQELEHLSISDIDLILRDQTDLYSPEELKELREWRVQLTQAKGIVPPPPATVQTTSIHCPKCEGWNKPGTTECVYCRHKLTKGGSHSASGSSHHSTGKLYGGILLLIAGLISVCYGISMNNSYSAQWDAFWNNGSSDPGTAWIVIGAVGLVLGLILITSALFKNKE